jgi:hypothetical protein
MEQELAEAKEEKRLAEFAQARAEQLAIARGEALYKCQERLTEAEQQQVQLAEVLKLTLDKLGMGLTPSPLPSQEYERSPGQLPDRPAGPLFASSNGHAIDTSTAMIAASINTTTTELAVVGTHHQLNSSSSEPDTPLSGFTVYSNELHDSPTAARGLDSRARSPTYYNNNEQQQRRQYLESLRPSSATKWKDISEVVHRSSPDCATPLGVGAPLVNINNAVASSGLDSDAEAGRLAQLIIRHLQASQLESLVRFGASLGSPTLASPTMQRHLVDALRKSRNEERGEYQDRMQQHVMLQAPPMPSVAPIISMPAPPRPLMQQQQQYQHLGGNRAGPLSQAAGWASPGLHGSSAHHIKTVFENVDGGGGASGGNIDNRENEFYKPFSAIAAGPKENLAEARDAIAMPAPPHPHPKKTVFKINDTAALPPPPSGKQHTSFVSTSSQGETIKAVMQNHDGVPDDDRFARQRRAAERLAAKINSKLPPEYRTADPLGLHGTMKNAASSSNISATNVASRPPSSIATSTSSGSGEKRAPKGSLRRRQQEAYRCGD